MVTKLNYIDFAKNTSDLQHGQRVAAICKYIGKELGFDKKQLQDIEMCALFHDIGKTQIDQDILDKPGRLTPEEFEEIKRHPECSCDILKDYEFFIGFAAVVRHHHEDYDGTGYPDGLKGKAIPLYSRIIRVADVFDALCSDRPYRDKCSVAEALVIMSNGFKGKFDTEIYQAFLRVIKKYGAKF